MYLCSALLSWAKFSLWMDTDSDVGDATELHNTCDVLCVVSLGGRSVVPSLPPSLPLTLSHTLSLPPSLPLSPPDNQRRCCMGGKKSCILAAAPSWSPDGFKCLVTGILMNKEVWCMIGVFPPSPSAKQHVRNTWHVKC